MQPPILSNKFFISENALTLLKYRQLAFTLSHYLDNTPVLRPTAELFYANSFLIFVLQSDRFKEPFSTPSIILNLVRIY